MVARKMVVPTLSPVPSITAKRIIMLCVNAAVEGPCGGVDGAVTCGSPQALETDVGVDVDPVSTGQGFVVADPTGGTKMRSGGRSCEVVEVAA